MRIQRGELNHWSHEQIETIDPDRRYPLGQEWKPFGFWVDVDRDWHRWCKAETFRPDGLAYRHRITIADDAKVLRLTNVPDLLQFTKDYAVPHPILGEGPGGSFFGPFHHYVIDWPRVAEQYQGVIIAPYLWSVRMDLMWYYGWDCASGCIWDPSILSISAVYFRGRRLR